MAVEYSWLIEQGTRLIRLIFFGALGYWGVNVVAQKVKKNLGKVYPDELRVELISSILFYSALTFLVLVLLHDAGLNVSALLGAAGVVGIAVGYAAQASIANIISGLFLMIERPFELGDVLAIEAVQGRVIRVNLFAVTVQTDAGTVIRIPHEQLLKNKFVTKVKGLVRNHTINVMISTEENIPAMMELMNSVAKRHAACAPNPAPTVEIVKFENYLCVLQLTVWARNEAAMAVLKRELPIFLKQASDAAKVYVFGLDMIIKE